MSRYCYIFFVDHGRGHPDVVPPASSSKHGSRRCRRAGGHDCEEVSAVCTKQASARAHEVRVNDSTIAARLSDRKINAAFDTDSMPETAGDVVRDLGLRRDASDVFALGSLKKYEVREGRGRVLHRDRR